MKERAKTKLIRTMSKMYSHAFDNPDVYEDEQQDEYEDEFPDQGNQIEKIKQQNKDR